MIYATPGQSREATTLPGLFATGLAGTVGFRIRDLQGGDALARTTTGIVEDLSGSAIYRKAFTAPSTAGQYEIVWDDGSNHYGTEELVVTYTPPNPGGGSGIDLCTLADVRLQMETESYDTGLDPLIAAQITAASRAIIDDTQRELAPATASATRRIDVGGYHIDLAPYDLRSAATVVFDPDASAVTLAAHVDYELLPIGGDKDGLYTEIKISLFRSLQTQKMQAFGHADLAITGAWGYAAVPETAKQACVVAVRAWVRRDLATYANLDPETRASQPPTAGTYAVPRAALSLVDGLRRYPKGMAIG